MTVIVEGAPAPIDAGLASTVDWLATDGTGGDGHRRLVGHGRAVDRGRDGVRTDVVDENVPVATPLASVAPAG